ncbi:PAS domain-containing sensor histidine kinase [bacterium]|nr:MAG: PAS domain-containing sensor histidine kinase [bacterium]
MPPKKPVKAPIQSAREVEEKYRQLFDAATDMIFLRDPEKGTLLDVNAAAYRLLGYGRDELLWADYFTLLANDAERAEARRGFAEALEQGSATGPAVLKRKDGSTFEAEVRNTPVRIAGKVWMLGIARDLTAQRQLERRALAFYQAFRNSNDSMFYTDRNGIIQDVNDAFVRRFGYSREEAVGRSPRIVRSRHTTDEIYKALWGDILSPEKGHWRGRLINRTKSGEEVSVLLSITAVRDAADRIVGFVSSAFDMTEIESLNRRLSKSESLAAVGAMAAVLAHEIRNPLGSLVTAAASLGRPDLPPDDRGALTNVLRTESRRLSDTLTQFLQYARPREPKLELADLAAVLTEVAALLRSDKGALGKVRLTLKADAALKPFPFDADQVRQVLLNIILNALQALAGKGRVALSAEVRDGHAAVVIADDGPGIPREVQKRLFEPFHTTKERGTGLGLAVAERVVSAHGGRILVETDLGRGTAFTVLLPLSPGDTP